tara:strand:+ start:516 stop:992 length:477 start_codon:yes stop_codon:yes gene_type:complete
MALSYNIETLASTERKLVVKFSMVNDTSTAELAKTDFIDPADYTSQEGKACSYVSIDRIWGTIETGIQVLLHWDASTDYYVWGANGIGSSSVMTACSDFTLGGWGGLVPPGKGASSVTANSGTGAGTGATDGTLLISTLGISDNDVFSVVVEGTKHYA